MTQKDLKNIAKRSTEELKNDKEFLILKKLLWVDVAIFLFAIVGTCIIRISQYR